MAGTHDIGFERDKRVVVLPTHKIDSNVDEEREYVDETLATTGLVAVSSHIKPAQPVTEAVTASGGEFHSDGRELVLVLRGIGLRRIGIFSKFKNRFRAQVSDGARISRPRPR